MDEPPGENIASLIGEELKVRHPCPRRMMALRSDVALLPYQSSPTKSTRGGEVNGRLIPISTEWGLSDVGTGLCAAHESVLLLVRPLDDPWPAGTTRGPGLRAGLGTPRPRSEPRSVVAFRRIEIQTVDRRDRLYKSLDVVAPEQHPGLAVEHCLARAARVDSDHWPAGGLRLDCGDAELLRTGHRDRTGSSVEPCEILVTDASEEVGLGVRSLELAVVGPGPDDANRSLRATRGLKSGSAFVAHKLPIPGAVDLLAARVRSGRSRLAGRPRPNLGRSSA